MASPALNSFSIYIYVYIFIKLSLVYVQRSEGLQSPAEDYG